MSWLKKQIEKRRWKAKLRQMDFVWRFRGGDGWQLFPPSYYYLYPLEELKKEEERILGELEAMIQNHQEKLKHPKNNPFILPTYRALSLLFPQIKRSCCPDGASAPFISNNSESPAPG